MKFENFGRIFSREWIQILRKRIHSAGVTVLPEAFAGYLVILSLTATFFLTVMFSLLPATQKYFLSLIGTFIPPLISQPIALNIMAVITIFVLSLLFIIFIIYVLVSAALILLTEARKNAVEAMLPDFLTLISANVRAGMTLDQAIWYAAKPEFGILSVEVKNVIKGTFSGESLSSTLDKLDERFDSKILERTIALIKQASVTGGEIAKILEMTATDARETAVLRKDIASSMVIYEIFILFSATLGAPFLFAVVNKLLGILEKSFSFEVQTTIEGMSFIKPSTPLVTSNDFFYFSLVTIFITVLISSLIVGVVRTSSKNQGLKYFPFMIVIAYLIYFLVSAVLESFFSSMII
ncbi:MAG: type II secretion system F family protein [Candidatus Micrarchaeota archaeon]